MAMNLTNLAFYTRAFLLSFCVLITGLSVDARATDLLEEKSIFEMSLEELLDLQVSIASTDSQSIHEAPSIVTSINRQQIEQQNPRNISDLLAMVPGFNLVIESLGAPLIQFRGTGNRQDSILLMIDGHRLNNQLFGGISYIINDIPVELIDRIEIIRGPGSAIYGSNAFEAVINLITVPEAEEKKTRLYGKYGSYDTRKSGVVYKDITAASHLIISGSAMKSNGPDDDYLDRSGMDGQIDFKQQGVNFYGNYQQDLWGIKALYNKEEDGAYAGILRYLNDDTERNYTTMFIEGEFNKDVGQAGHLRARLYMDSFDYDCDWMLVPARLYVPNGYVKQTTATDSRIGSELTYKTVFSEQHQLMFGASYDFLELRNSELSQTDSGDPSQIIDIAGGWIEEERNYHYALYGQDYFPFFFNGKVTVGMRYDNYDNYGDSFSPRLGISIPLQEESHLKLLYGSAFRAPSYYESNTQPSGLLLRNPDIEAEKLQTVEAEYCFTIPQVQMRVNGYYTTVSDIIETVQISGNNTKMNQGDINTYGIEAEIHYLLPNQPHTITLNGFWNHATDDDDKEVLSVARYGAALILASQWTGDLTSNIQFKYTSPMRKAPIYDNNGVLLQEVDNLDQTFTVNVAMGYQYKAATIKIGLYNLFDESLLAPAPSALNANNVPESDYPYNRRFFMLGLEYSF